jgi:class 3 adenylate cyclase/pimeloyl-ACP methyl ester carboxylesterase
MGCGARLERTCAACGAAAPPEARFCGACGAALGAGTAAPAAEPSGEQKLARYVPRELADKILATRGRIEGERRQVTVLFCDLADSTRIAEDLDPEVYRQLLDAYLEAAIACIHRFEGVINQFAGDGFMAIFGAPIAHDDDAARACRAGLAIVAEMHVLARSWEARLGQRLAARIGMNTGPVIVGTVGSDLRMDYTAVGDTTNTAARIQAYARPGEICLAETTRKLVADGFETEESGTPAFKGKQGRVAVFRLVREISRRERRHQALRGGLARFYGRNTELALLHDRYDQARSGSGQVVFLAGEAGIGKSRLIHEFRRLLDPAAYHWLEGQCVGYGTRSAYLPFIDLLHGVFDIDEADSAEVIIDKVHRRAAAIGGAVAAAEPFYRDLLAVDAGDRRVAALDENVKLGFFFESCRDLVLALGQDRPVVLLFEDVHWIDQSSEQLLRRLLASVAATRVLALITHRTDYTWPHGDRSYFSHVALHGLPAALVDELAESVLGRSDLPRPLRRLIAERSDGNPFFVEEVAKSLRERGVLDRDLGAIRFADEVPSTVQEVILARIDRLDEEAKRALQVAAVIGREFTLRVLERAGSWRRSSAEALDQLRSLELIYEKTAHAELAYMFKHALTHEVAYLTLLSSQRRELHRQIAGLIEELYADRLPEFYEALAYQYRQAELPERAARYALLAGERARSHFAPEAELFFREAIELAGGPGTREVLVRAWSGLGDLHILAGRIDAANEAYREAIAAGPDPETLRRLHHKLTRRHYLVRDGVRVAYYVQGEAEGDPARAVPIVMLHPFIQGSYGFQYLALRLCQDFCVVYMDPRGVGASDRTDEPYSFETQVEDAVAMLRELPYRRVVLKADSDGVRMALRVFHALPEQVEKMVLFGGGARVSWAPDYPEGLSEEIVAQALDRLLAPDYRSALEHFFNMIFSDPGLSALREQVTETWERTIAPETYRQFLAEIPRFDDRHLLGGIKVPTLVMAARDDRAVPLPLVRYVAEHIPGAIFAVINGVGHSANSTATETYAEIMRTFIHTGTLPRTEWAP